MKKLLMCLAFAILLTGCGGQDKEPKDTGNTQNQDNTEQGTGDQQSKEAGKGYVFAYNGVNIPMNVDVEPVLESLGEPQQYFEAESCAFKGLDKTFYYNGFELTTYPKTAEQDYISSVYFKDDTVSTPEGIYIGSTVEDMLEAYGDDYTGGEGSYTYTKEDSSILFIVENDEITAITYLAVVEELQ